MLVFRNILRTYQMSDPLLQNQIYRIQYLLPDSSRSVALALIFHDMSSIHSRQLHVQS